MKILVIEDEINLLHTIREFLEGEHFIVEYATDYHIAMEKISIYEYDCILLDIMLPGGNGLSLLKELKKIKKNTGVLIISAKDSIDDKVTGLNFGADDYLAKPFHLAELNARIKSIIRRRQAEGENYIKYGNVSLFPDERIVTIESETVEFNRKEFDLLYYFIVNSERLISKTALAEAVWGDHIDQSDSFDFIYSQVKNLRKKLNHAGATAHIEGVYGFGYKFIIQEEE